MRRTSVRTVVAASLVTVITLLLAIAGAFNYSIRRNEAMAQLRMDLSAKADELSAGLALPIWNIDRPQIDKILLSRAKTRFLTGIVVEAAGRTHAYARNAGGELVPSNGPPMQIERGLIERRPIVFSNEHIGTVTLYGTSRYVNADLRRSLLTLIATIVAVDLLLIATIYSTLWRVVLRPLVELERYAGAVSAAGKELPPPAHAEHARTAELESVRTSIESMVRQLEERYRDLRLSEERYRTIVDSINDAIVIDDVETERMIDVNARMEEMFGYSRDEILGMDIESLSSGIEPFTQQHALERIRAARRGSTEIFEWQARHRDGHLFWTEVSTRTAVLEGRLAVIVVMRNIEYRKKMEEELRRSATMSAMGALVGGVAHEVRNPLFGMSALLDAYATEIPPHLEELTSGLRTQVTRLTKLMRDLLEFGRPVTLNPTPASLADLVADVVNARRKRAADAGVTLTYELPPSLPLVPMDRDRMWQVFENLIDNAIHHAPAVHNVKVVASSKEDGGRLWIETAIEDDGSGFATQDLARVFEPFFTRRDHGVGLGLSIVQRIVEQHGGRVVAANRPEGGASVTVRLPVARENEIHG